MKKNGLVTKAKRRYVRRKPAGGVARESVSAGTPDSVQSGSGIAGGTTGRDRSNGDHPTARSIGSNTGTSSDPAQRTTATSANSGSGDSGGPTSSARTGKGKRSKLDSAISEAKEQGAARVSIQVEELKSSGDTDSDPNDRFARYRERKRIANESEQTAGLLLDVLDGVAQGFIDREAAMTTEERDLIVKPLARLVQRLDLDTQEKIQTYSDPVMLVLALGMWGSRVSSVYRRKNPPKVNPPPAATPPDDQPASDTTKSNGSGPHVETPKEDIAAITNPNSDPMIRSYLGTPVG